MKKMVIYFKLQRRHFSIFKAVIREPVLNNDFDFDNVSFSKYKFYKDTLVNNNINDKL